MNVLPVIRPISPISPISYSKHPVQPSRQWPRKASVTCKFQHPANRWSQTARELSVVAELVRVRVTVPTPLNSCEFSYVIDIMETASQISGLDLELPHVAKLTVQVSVCLGRQQMRIKDLCRMVPGAIISLEMPSDAPIELVAKDLLLATGETVRNGTRLGFRLRQAESRK